MTFYLQIAIAKVSGALLCAALPLSAARLQDWADRLTPPVLAHQDLVGPGLAAAEIRGVLQEPLLAAEEPEDEFGDGCIRDVEEAGADPRVSGVDEADQNDAELAVQIRHQVRKFPFAAI